MPVRVIAVGNPVRGDDSVALAALDRLEAAGVLTGFDAVRHTGDWAALSELLRTSRAALVLDAVEGAGEPGTIVSLGIGPDGLPGTASGDPRARFSGHGQGLAEALELARLLGHLPSPCLFLGVQGDDYGLWRPLSPKVAAALPGLVERARAALNQLGAGSLELEVGSLGAATP